jgi:hypothetical protein
MLTLLFGCDEGVGIHSSGAAEGGFDGSNDWWGFLKVMKTEVGRLISLQ